MKIRNTHNFVVFPILVPTLCSAAQPASPHVQPQHRPQQPILNPHANPNETLHHRNATLADAPAIASIIIAAFSGLPSWNYLYQFHKQHPEEHLRCTTQYIATVLSHDWGSGQVIEVREAPETAHEDASKKKKVIIAAALWMHQSNADDDDDNDDDDEDADTSSYPHFPSPPYINHLTPKPQKRIRAPLPLTYDPSSHPDFSSSSPSPSKNPSCTHRDLNATRAISYATQWNALLKSNLPPFGMSQLYLELLGTDPAFQGRGAATRLVRAGLGFAGRERVNVTLFAQPTAETFYTGLGFREVRNVSLESVDGDERFGFNLMAREGWDG